jgi:hypothetical protein
MREVTIVAGTDFFIIPMTNGHHDKTPQMIVLVTAIGTHSDK